MDDATRDYLDAKLDPIATDMREVKQDMSTINGRLRAVELFRAYVYGVGSVLALLAGGGAATWLAMLR